MSDLSETIEAIVAEHRQRCYWMENRKRTDLSLGSYLRTALGWSLALPAGERTRIKNAAANMVEIGERHSKQVKRAHLKAVKDAAKLMAKGQPEATSEIVAKIPPIPPELGRYAGIILGTIEGRAIADNAEGEHTKEMKKLAKRLPIYDIVENIAGAGALGLAIIVAEAPGLNHLGLGEFATKGKLYKRLGLAVLEGVRQGGLPKGAPKAKWIEHGYSKQRRSRIWTIGVSLVKNNKGRYREIYLDRKAYERARAEAEGLTVAPAGSIPKKRQAEYRSLGHIDSRARRYMEKRLICDLWRAWRRATNSDDRADHPDTGPIEAQIRGVPLSSELAQQAA